MNRITHDPTLKLIMFPLLTPCLPTLFPLFAQLALFSWYESMILSCSLPGSSLFLKVNFGTCFRFCFQFLSLCFLENILKFLSFMKNENSYSLQVIMVKLTISIGHMWWTISSWVKLIWSYVTRVTKKPTNTKTDD